MNSDNVARYRIESVMNFTLEDSRLSQIPNSRSDDAVMYIGAIIKFTNNNDLPLRIDDTSTELHHTNNKGSLQRFQKGGVLLLGNTHSIVSISH